jgi:hypothetical protein
MSAVIMEIISITSCAKSATANMGSMIRKSKPCKWNRPKNPDMYSHIAGWFFSAPVLIVQSVFLAVRIQFHIEDHNQTGDDQLAAHG